jgi:hypothetical protein
VLRKSTLIGFLAKADWHDWSVSGCDKSLMKVTNEDRFWSLRRLLGALRFRAAARGDRPLGRMPRWRDGRARISAQRSRRPP